jgi:hypothetical protein
MIEIFLEQSIGSTPYPSPDQLIVYIYRKDIDSSPQETESFRLKVILKVVEEVDAEVAYEILVFALFKEVKSKKREKKQKTVDDDDSDSEGDSHVWVH